MKTKVTLYNSYTDNSSQSTQSLTSLIETLTEVAQKVPKEFLENVIVETIPHCDHDNDIYIEMDIYYLREETSKEVKLRHEKEAAKLIIWENQQKQQYEKLKKIFDP